MAVIRVGQISDFHARLAQPGSSGINNRRSREMKALLPAVLREIAGKQVDFLAVTGDLLDVPNYVLTQDDYYDYRLGDWDRWIEADYRWFKAQLDACGIPYMVLPGNHDNSVMWRVFDAAANVADVKGYRIYRFCDRETDNHVPRRRDRERKLFEQALQDPARQIHLQHYVVTPELNQGYPHTYFEGATLAEKVVATGRVSLSLSGHYHAGTPPIRVGETTFATVPAFCVSPHPYRIYDVDGSHVRMQQYNLRKEPVIAGRPVVFLDRDGVINTLASYNTGPEEMRLVPGAGRAIARLHEAGYAVVVITAQSCVGYGYVVADTVHAVHDRMNELLAAEAGSDAGTPDAIYFSTGAGENACAPSYANHENAKPSIGLLQQAVDLFQLNWQGAWMVGDRYTDLQTAENAGIDFALVRTGDGPITEEKCRTRGGAPTVVAENLEEAVTAILARRTPAESRESGRR